MEADAGTSQLQQLSLSRERVKVLRKALRQPAVLWLRILSLPRASAGNQVRREKRPGSIFAFPLTTRFRGGRADIP